MSNIPLMDIPKKSSAVNYVLNSPLTNNNFSVQSKEHWTFCLVRSGRKISMLSASVQPIPNEYGKVCKYPSTLFNSKKEFKIFLDREILKGVSQ